MQKVFVLCCFNFLIGIIWRTGEVLSNGTKKPVYMSFAQAKSARVVVVNLPRFTWSRVRVGLCLLAFWSVYLLLMFEYFVFNFMPYRERVYRSEVGAWNSIVLAL